MPERRALACEMNAGECGGDDPRKNPGPLPPARPHHLLAKALRAVQAFASPSQ